MTAAELLEGDDTLNISRLEELHALLDEFHQAWRKRAACLDERPEVFFPIGNAHTVLLHIEKAKAVCRRCEVAEGCLTWAMDSGRDAGVWGGLSEDERHALMRHNARARRVS